MMRCFILLCSLLLSGTPNVNADERRGPRIRIGRVEFGIPFVDSFVTVDGDRTTVKVFSRGDVANVHRDTGTQVDVGIRSLFIPRRPMRGPGVLPSDGNPPGATRDARLGPNQNSPQVQLGEQQAIETSPSGKTAGSPSSDPRETPLDKSEEQGPELVIPQKNRSSQAADSASDSPLEKAEEANARGDYGTAEKLASDVLARREDDHAAYSIRAASLIGQGEQERNVNLIRRGLSDVNKAIKLGKQKGDENKRDYVVWLIGVNQLAALDSDRGRAAGSAKMVDDFTIEHIDKFPGELKEKVYHQQGFARLLLGKRTEAEESFRNAAKSGAGKEGR